MIRDVRLREVVRERCKESVLYWVNLFVWTYNPKDHPEEPVVPMVTWGYQDEVMPIISDAIGRHDLLIEKSRDMGASWMCLLVFLHRWMFFNNQSFLLVSRNEMMVDKRHETDSLFWKLDFAIEHMPDWFLPGYEGVTKKHRTRLKIYNPFTKSVITGASTTGDCGRGGRKTAQLYDEFAACDDGHAMLAASRDATNCRIFNSTPKGTGNAFYDMSQKINPRHKLTLHWSRHPLKSDGLYQSMHGKVKWHKNIRHHYSPIIDGRMRSPWYDLQCQRAGSEQEIAQELDIDYARSGWQFFDAASMKRLEENVRMPLFHGEVQSDGSFVLLDSGRLKLWCMLDSEGRVPDDRDYAIGCDIATGTATEVKSNSAMSVIDCLTGEKVAEFVVGDMQPSEFAEYVVWACEFFTGTETAYLIWEANGPGSQFTLAIERLGYRRVFWRKRDGFKGVRPAQGDKMGFHTSKKSKRALLSEYAVALKTGKLINHSIDTLRECSQYVHMPGGDVVHSRALSNKLDPTGQGDNHGDIVIADALAWYIVSDTTVKQEEKPLVYPDMSLGNRMRLFERQISQFDESLMWK